MKMFYFRNFLHFENYFIPNKSITYVTVLNQLTKPITTTSHQIKFLLGGIYSNLYIEVEHRKLKSIINHIHNNTRTNNFSYLNKLLIIFVKPPTLLKLKFISSITNYIQTLLGNELLMKCQQQIIKEAVRSTILFVRGLFCIFFF